MLKPTKEEILYAFAVEEIQDRVTLANYLRDYPEYGADLIDLCYELSLQEPAQRELTEVDKIMIELAWELLHSSEEAIANV